MAIQFLNSPKVGDNVKIELGTGVDLELYSNGTDGYVVAPVDDLVLQAADDIFIYTQGGEDAIIAKGNAAVELYYDNAKKFETTANGVNIVDSELGIGAGHATASPGNAVIFAPYGAGTNIAGGEIKIFSGRSTGDADGGSIKFYISPVGSSGSSANAHAQVLLLDSSKNATFAGSLFLPDNRDIGWNGGYSAGKPTLAAAGTTIKMFPSGSVSGLQFSLTPTDATFAGNVIVDGSVAVNTEVQFGRELLVKGEIAALAQDSGNNQLLLSASSTQTNISSTFGGTGSYAPMQFETGGAVRVHLTASGNLGIGTTSPTTKLTISDNSAQVLLIDTSSNNTLEVEVGDEIVSFKLDKDGAAENSKFVWSIDDETRMELAITEGNNSQLKLNNYGSGAITGTAAYTLQVDDAGNVIEGSTSGGGTVTGSGTATRVAFWSGTTALSSDANLYWDNTNDRLGIGTTSPAHKLDVQVSGNVARFGDGTRFFRIYTDSDEVSLLADGSVPMKFYTSGSERMRIDSSGNVGIGTTAPQKVLDVAVSADSVATVGASLMAVGKYAGIHFGYRENNTSYRKSAIVFERTDLLTGNAQGKVHILNGPQAGNGSATLADSKLTINEYGNVGIGTASPTGFRLVVENTSEDLLKLHNSTDGLDALISFTNPGGTLGRIQGLDNGGLGFDTGNNAGGINTNAMVIDSSGEVGIGITAPTAKLHVSGSAKVSNLTMNPDYSASNLYLVLNKKQANDGGIILNSKTAAGATQNDWQIVNIGTSADLRFYAYGLAGSALTLDRETGNATFAGKVIVGKDSSNALEVFSSGDTEIGFSYATKGNIYAKIIGDITTASPLGGELAFQTATGGTLAERMRIDSSGKVGIGTTSPIEKLQVVGQLISTASNSTAATSGSERAIMDLSNYSATDHSARFGHFRGATSAGAGQLRLYTDSVERVRIDASGNVGIGTTSPNGKLDIKTSNSGFEFFPENSTDTNLLLNFDRTNSNYLNLQLRAATHQFVIGTTEKMRIDTSGNVGIGNTSPVAKLDVVGSSSGAAIRVAGLNTDSAEYYYGFMHDATDLQGTTQVNIFQSGGAIKANTTITDYAGIRIDTPSVSATSAVITNNYGIYQSSSLQKNYFAGNVGIGTTSPASLSANTFNLSLNSSRTDLSSGLFLQANGSTKSTLYWDTAGLNIHNASGDTKFSAGGSERMRIESGGDVGIGTTNPQQLLHISNSSGDFGAEAVLRGSTSTGTPKSEIAFKRFTSGDGATMVLRTSNSSGIIQDVLTLDTSKNATFAGNVTLNSRLTFDYGGDHYFEAGTDTIAYKSSSGSSIMSLNASTSVATFPGKVSVGGGDTSTAQMALKGQQSLLSFIRGTSGDAQFFMSSDSQNLYFSHTDIQSTNLILKLNKDESATFAGDVTIGSSGASSDKTLNILTGGTKSSVKLMEAGTVYGFSTVYDGAANEFHINRHNNSAAGTPVLSLNRDDDNATFAGNVTANGVYSAGQSAIIYKAQRNGGAVASDWSYDDATTDMSLGTSTGHSFSLKTNNTRALTINSSQNATFVGTVLSAGFLVGQTSQYSPTGGGGTLATFTGAGSNRQDIVVSNQTNNANAAASLVLATHGHDFIIKGTSSAGGSILSLGFNTTPFLSLTSSSATFAGGVTINHSSGESLLLTKSTTEPSVRFEGDTNKDFVLTVSGETFTITQNDGATDILILDHDTKNATFAGGVKIAKASANLDLAQADEGSHFRIELDSADDTYISTIGGNPMYLRTDQTTALTLDASQNATFAGDVGLGGTGLYTTSHSLNIDGTGLAIKNDTSGSNNNWSHITNTATSSASNLVFTTGLATALTLAHSGKATFAADTSATSEVLTLKGTHATGDVSLYFNQTTTRRTYINYENSTGNFVFASEYGGVKFMTGTNGTETEKMVIQADGDVGIGVTNPVNKLQVGGKIYSSTDIQANAELRGATLRLPEGGNGSDISEPVGFIDINVNGTVYVIPYYTRD